MPNFIERLRNRTVEPAPVQNVALSLRDQMIESKEIEKFGGPRETFEQKQWVIKEMANLGLGTGLDTSALSGSYYATLIKTCLEVNIAGGNLAVDLSVATKDLIKVMDPNKDLVERSRIAFEICESLAKQRGSSNMAKIAKEYPIIFEPWVDLVKVVADSKKAVLQNMTSLDRAVERNGKMLETAGKIIKSSGSKLADNADKYDKQLGMDKEVKEIQDNLSKLGQGMIAALSMGDRSVSEIAKEIVREKTRLSKIPIMAKESNEAIKGVLQATATDMFDTAAVQAMAAASRSIVMAQQANLVAGTAIPMLAITGLAGAIQTASWLNLYTTYRLLGEISGSPDLSMTPREVRNAIAAANAASRQRYLEIKNETYKKISAGGGQ